MAVSLYLLDQVITEDSSKDVEEKFKVLHPIYFMVLSKLDEVDELFISQITPILIKYTKRYFSSQIKASQQPDFDIDYINKEQKKVIELLENSLDGLDTPSAVLSLCQFYLNIAPVAKYDTIIPHLIRIYKVAEIEGGVDNEIIGYTILDFIEEIVRNDAILTANAKVIKQFTSLRFMRNLYGKQGQSQYYVCKKITLLDYLCTKVEGNTTLCKLVLEEFYHHTKSSSPIIGLIAVDAIKNNGLRLSASPESSEISQKPLFNL